MFHSLKVSFLAISAQLSLHPTFTFIHLAPFSIVLAIACLIALLYGILFSIWFAILNQTILAFKSGFLISLTSKLTFTQSFLANKAIICSLFSPVLPNIREALAVYTTISNISWFLETSISHKGIQVNCLLSISLAFTSIANEVLYVFLSSYQVDFHVLIYGILNAIGFTLCPII
jgi:hypothetical protein